LLPSVASCVFNNTSPAPDETVTLSDTFPISSATSTFDGLSMRAETSVVIAFLNPAASTSSVYLPGGIRLKEKAPESLVVCVREKFFSALVSVTFAPATRLPCGSATVPLIVDVPDWATAVITESESAKTTPRITDVKFRRSCFLINSSQEKVGSRICCVENEGLFRAPKRRRGQNYFSIRFFGCDEP